MSNNPNTFTGGDSTVKTADESAQGLNPTTSASSFDSPLMRPRPRSKSVPTIVEQRVALSLRNISDDINSCYDNSSRNATDRNRRASYPGNFLRRALSLGSQEGTVIRHRQTGVGAYPSQTSMGSVPEEELDSGDEV